jgi:hypothetical protein
MMRQRIFVLAGFGVLLGCGVVHGLWTNRWSAAAAVEAAARRVPQLPTRIGDWDGEELELGSRERQMAGGAAYLRRRYVNARTGATAAIYLVCGRPGPVSVHTPDVCYSDSGLDVVGEPTPHPVQLDGAAPAEFNRIEVRGREGKAATVRQEVLWSWAAGGKWQTPRSPRLAFARYPVLYKLYVIRPLPAEAGPAGDDAGADDFIRVLLPEVETCLLHGP